LGAKILKGVKNCSAFSRIRRLAERDEIWHNEGGHWCVAGLNDFGELRSSLSAAQIFDSGYLAHFRYLAELLSERDENRQGRVRGLANQQLCHEFRELMFWVARYHAATFISPSMMHLLTFSLICSIITCISGVDFYHTTLLQSAISAGNAVAMFKFSLANVSRYFLETRQR